MQKQVELQDLDNALAHKLQCLQDVLARNRAELRTLRKVSSFRLAEAAFMTVEVHRQAGELSQCRADLSSSRSALSATQSALAQKVLASHPVHDSCCVAVAWPLSVLWAVSYAAVPFIATNIRPANAEVQLYRTLVPPHPTSPPTFPLPPTLTPSAWYQQLLRVRT